MSLADIEKDLEAAALAGEAGLMGKSTTADATKPVVFQGKVYQIPAHLTVETVFQNAGLKENAKRQFQLRFDKSPVVLQPRTLALVKAAGCNNSVIVIHCAMWSSHDVCVYTLQ